MKIHYCRVCRDKGRETVLDDENWLKSFRERGNYICKECNNERSRLWREENHERHKANCMRYNRKNGHLPMSENRECGLFLGVWIAERFFRHFFNDVEVMPPGNPGFDFICNKGMKMDSKSSCLNNDGSWMFNIGRNTIADYFLCIAFDNREDLNPMHVWLIPGDVLNDHITTRISPNTVSRWDEYEYDITGVIDCCDTMKNGAT